MELRQPKDSIHSCLLPRIQRPKKPIASIINNYISTIDNNVESLDKIDGQVNLHRKYKESYSHQPFRKRKAIIKFSCVPEKISIKKNSVLNAYRLRLTKKQNSLFNEDNTTIAFRTIDPVLSSCSMKFKQKKVLRELEMIDRLSISVNQNLLSDVSLYHEKNKQFNSKYDRIITENNKTIELANEYLQPEQINYFDNKHSNQFYSKLDHVIGKVCGHHASINLFRDMKLFNKKVHTKENIIQIKRIKQRERYTKLIDQNELIHNKIYA